MAEEVGIGRTTGFQARCQAAWIILPPQRGRFPAAILVRLDFRPPSGPHLKAEFAGWTACFFSSDTRLPKLIGLRPDRKTPLYNGAIECRLFEFKMVSGSNRPK